jgi:exodeoxyribonuclease VII small subunit
MTEAKKKKKDPTFEEALSRLEVLVKEMESGTMDLEKMMGHFEEGNQLVKFCTTKLNEVEHKIELLARKGDGLATQPFDEAAEGD